MKYVPKSVQRFGYRQILKGKKSSPTLMVVGGVVGLSVTAVMAARATRKLDPIIEEHSKARFQVDVDVSDGVIVSQRQQQRELVKVYGHTSFELAKLYAPTIVVGTLSATSVLYGHKILHGRHIATMAAYGGLMEQFQAYRARVAHTVGSELERDIHNGAVGQYEEDPEHKGEYKLRAKFGDDSAPDYLRPFFDEANQNWTLDPYSNYQFLTGVQSHMNNLLQIRGVVFLFEAFDALGIPRTPESIVTGWMLGGGKDDYIDFGFLASNDPQAILFRNGAERSVRLNFNIDGVIWDKL